MKILVDLEISISFFLFSFFPPLIIFITFTRVLFIVCSTSIKDFVKTSLKMTWKSKRLHHMAIDILERDYNITQWYRNFHEAVSLNWTKIYVPTCSRLIESIDENRGCARRTLLRISHDVCAIFNLAEDQCGGVVYRGVFEASYSRGGSFVPLPSVNRGENRFNRPFDRFSIIFVDDSIPHRASNWLNCVCKCVESPATWFFLMSIDLA